MDHSILNTLNKTPTKSGKLYTVQEERAQANPTGGLSRSRHRELNRSEEGSLVPLSVKERHTDGRLLFLEI